MKITAAVTEPRARRSRCRSSSSATCARTVLVRVAAAGICHTDLIMRDQWYPVPLPAVLGHEGPAWPSAWDRP